MAKKGKAHKAKENDGYFSVSRRKDSLRGPPGSTDRSHCPDVKGGKTPLADRADKNAGKTDRTPENKDPIFASIIPTPSRSSPTELIIPRSKAEADILTGGNQSSRHRQLPCRTYVSTGCCPYKDRCIYLHDPRVQSAVQVSAYDTSHSFAFEFQPPFPQQPLTMPRRFIFWGVPTCVFSVSNAGFW